MSPQLLAISDLHITHHANRAVCQRLRPASDSDWLVICGDISDTLQDVAWAFAAFAQRFAKVIWTPGNHELWTTGEGEGALRGVARYRHLVDLARANGVLTPEDPYPIWAGDDGPLMVAPVFTLYDYSFGRNVAGTAREAMAKAHEAGVVCTDEYLLHPDPHSSREAWCRERVAYTEQRLGQCASDLPLVLASHFPLTSRPTEALLHPEFAQWCGTALTAAWHRRFNVLAVLYGHLHIPRTTWQDGVRFEEVSLGYPREWQRRTKTPSLPRAVFPRAETHAA